MAVREEMKLSDLKTGMIVTNRLGIEYTVLLNAVWEDKSDDVIVSGDKWWNLLSNFASDMTHRGTSDLDIVKVEESKHPFSFLDPSYARYKRKILWVREGQKREEVRQVTMAEVEEKFGCKVKIVKGETNAKEN